MSELMERLKKLLKTETVRPGGKVIKIHPETHRLLMDEFGEMGNDRPASPDLSDRLVPDPLTSISVVIDEDMLEGELLLVETIWRWY